MKSINIFFSEIHSSILHFITIPVCIFFTLNTFAGVQATYYVSPNGNDTNPGTMNYPFATIEKARDIARTINRNMTGDIIIYLRGGTYELTSAFILSSLDSGTNGFNIIYQAYNCEIPVISGGIKIPSWLLFDTIKNIYRATVNNPNNTRQLYVNDVRAIRARSLDASGWTESGDGYDCPAEVSTWKNIKNVEVVSTINWQFHRGSINSIHGSSHAVMAQPYWTYSHEQFDAPPAWIENAYELLDSEREWYLDRSDGSLYYKPRKGEDMANAEIILPKLETLLRGSTVNNIQFKGITFGYSTWHLPISSGFPCAQADVIYIGFDFQEAQISGNIMFDHSKNIRFENNVFKHLGKTALQFYKGCKNNSIYNNIFDDISGSAISIGEITSDTPSNNDLVKNNFVDNNLIRNVAVEYQGCVGIFVGYTENTTITHNEIRNLPYTGISVGWGWDNTIIAGKNNEISFNLIDSIMMKLSDGGGIYTLSSQPGTNVHNNYIKNQLNNYAALYTDEGSSNMHWHHNVVSKVPLWLIMYVPSIENDTVDFNYYDSQNEITDGSDCVVQNNVFVPDDNWPIEAITIMKNARRVSIKNKLTGISVTPESSVLQVNESLRLAVNLTSCDSINTNMNWVSSDPNVATVSSTGLVNAKSIGNAKIILTTENNLKLDSIEVSVIAQSDISVRSSISNFIYPNPATTKLNIKELQSSDAIIMIFDLHGKLLLNNQINDGEIDISNLPRGIYIVKLIDSGNVLISKLVKE